MGFIDIRGLLDSSFCEFAALMRDRGVGESGTGLEMLKKELVVNPVNSQGTCFCRIHGHS